MVYSRYSVTRIFPFYGLESFRKKIIEADKIASCHMGAIVDQFSRRNYSGYILMYAISAQLLVAGLACQVHNLLYLSISETLNGA